MGGRNLGDMIAGAMGQAERTGTKIANKSSELKDELTKARESGDEEAAGRILDTIKERREALAKEGGVKSTQPKKKRKVYVGSSKTELPSMQDLLDLAKEQKERSEPKPTTLPATNLSTIQDIADEVQGWGSEPSNPGQWGKERWSKTDEAMEMEASPDGPKNPGPELASQLMDVLTAHHNYLHQFLKTLPDAVRAHAHGSPYFSPAHELFARQLETQSQQTFGKSDREALREKRDAIEASIPGGATRSMRRRGILGIAKLDQNLAAMSYRTPVHPMIKGIEEPQTSYTSDVDWNSAVKNWEQRKSEATKSIYGEIEKADLAGMRAPRYVSALTVGLPRRLALLKAKMDDLRPNGVFATDDPSVNHKAIMDIAEEMGQINSSINTSLAEGTRSAIKETYKNTGFSLQNKFKNFFGTSLHKKIFDHVMWRGKNLSQKQPSESWRDFTHPNDEIAPENYEKLPEGAVMSKRGHMWGLTEKDELGYRRRGGRRDQIEITQENADALKNSKDGDEQGRTAHDLGLQMQRIIDDHNAGNTAKYKMYKLPAHWQATQGKGGSGTARLVGEGDENTLMEQRAAQVLYPYTPEAIAAQARKSNSFVTESGETVTPGIPSTAVKGTKNKPARSSSVISGEVAVSGVARKTAVANVKMATDIAGAVERAKTALTTYDKEGNTQSVSPEDAALIKSSSDALLDFNTHVQKHRELIKQHAETIRSQGRNAIPQEDRKFLGESGLLEAERRANLPIT